MGRELSIRHAVEGDLARLTAIYNHYVVETPTTFDLEPFTPEQRRPWFRRYAPAGRHRLLVAERDGCVLAYASSSPYHARPAYDTTVEMTIISAPEAVGQRLGQALYEAIFDSLRGEDVRSAVAAITLPNDASCALHERFGFRRVGVIEQAGRKFGRYWDVAWYQRLFD